MVLEYNDFPLVRMRYDAPVPEDGESAFETFERLLKLEKPFVLIGLGTASHDDSPETRKHVSLWMKRHREALKRYVIAMVAVEPQAANRFVARSQAETYQKFWGFPMLVTVKEEEAVGIAERLLSGEPAAEINVNEPHVPSAR